MRCSSHNGPSGSQIIPLNPVCTRVTSHGTARTCSPFVPFSRYRQFVHTEIGLGWTEMDRLRARAEAVHTKTGPVWTGIGWVGACPETMPARMAPGGGTG